MLKELVTIIVLTTSPVCADQPAVYTEETDNIITKTYYCVEDDAPATAQEIAEIHSLRLQAMNATEEEKDLLCDYYLSKYAHRTSLEFCENEFINEMC